MSDLSQIDIIFFYFSHIRILRVPLSSTPPSVQHISSTQKGHSFSAPEIPQFNTKNPSVTHEKPLSSIHSSFANQNCGTEGFLVWN